MSRRVFCRDCAAIDDVVVLCARHARAEALLVALEGQETATARVKPTLRVTVFGGDGADAEALRRAMDA